VTPKLLVSYVDPEPLIVDLLTDLLEDYDDEITVSNGVPSDWNVDEDPPHIEVDHDGTPTIDAPIRAICTVRIVARASDTDLAKRAALLAQGLLLAHSGFGGTLAIDPGAGLLPAYDKATRQQLASFTLNVSVPTEPLAPSGS
jgi:hypothetical protein